MVDATSISEKSGCGLWFFSRIQKNSKSLPGPCIIFLLNAFDKKCKNPEKKYSSFENHGSKWYSHATLGYSIFPRCLGYEWSVVEATRISNKVLEKLFSKCPFVKNLQNQIQITIENARFSKKHELENFFLKNILVKTGASMPSICIHTFIVASQRWGA